MAADDVSGIVTVILGQIVVMQPFVIAIVYARLQNFDWAIVDSAEDLGATPAKAFFTVTLPVIQPTLVGAELIALAISLDDFIITFFMIGSGNTLPTMVWGLVRTHSTDDQCVGDASDRSQHWIDALALKLSSYRG